MGGAMQQIENETKAVLEGQVEIPSVRQRFFRTHDALCNYVKSFKICVYNVRLVKDNMFELVYEGGE